MSMTGLACDTGCGGESSRPPEGYESSRRLEITSGSPFGEGYEEVVSVEVDRFLFPGLMGDLSRL